MTEEEDDDNDEAEEEGKREEEEEEGGEEEIGRADGARFCPICGIIVFQRAVSTV